jgi:flagellar motor switch protein FliN
MSKTADSSLTTSDGTSPNLDSILRIPVAVQIFLGAAFMPIADLMKLGQGAVVSLDHNISDPVDVVVNGRVIARGELIALEEDPTKIGVKLTEIISRSNET